MLSTITKYILNFFNRFRKKEIKEIKKILFLFPSSAVGDTVVETFFIREIKKLFPQAKLDIFILKPSAALLQGNQNVNCIFTMPVNKYKKLCYLAWSVLSLRKNRYDLILDLPHSGYAPFRQIFLYLLGPAQVMSCNVKGYDFITYPLQWKEGKEHITKAVYIKALEMLGASEPFQVYYDLSIPPAAQEAVSSFWEKYHLNNKKVLLFNTEGSSPSKTLSNKRVLEIIYALQKAYPQYQVLLLAYRKNFSEFPKEIPVLYTKSILVSAAAVQKADYILTVDTGITHIADAYQKRMCILFSESIKKEFRPWVCHFWGSITEATMFAQNKKNVNCISNEEIVAAVTQNMPKEG